MQVTHQGICDPETGEGLQTVYTLADDADVGTIVAAALRCQEALWTVIRKANERKYLKLGLVRRKRAEGLARARAAKMKIREQDITNEEIAINTSMVKLEAEIRADAQMAGEPPEACMERLRAEGADDTLEAA